MSTLMVVTGEPSGDQRAAEVVREVQRNAPGVKVFGMGGEHLAGTGMEIVVDIAEMSIFGVTEILSRYFTIKKNLILLFNEWQTRKPDVTLFIDFGGFNLKLAEKIKNAGGKTAYFICPQVWASRPGRIEKIRQFIDLPMVLFHFEKEFYAQHGVEAVHAGHPLLDELKVYIPETSVEKTVGDIPLVGLMPGSRRSELQRHLALFSEAINRLRQKRDIRFVIFPAPGFEEYLEPFISAHDLEVTDGERYAAMARCDCMIMASGTAALETGLLRVPSVVIYKTSWLTEKILRAMMTVDRVSLPNILLKEDVFPELIQKDARAERIVAETIDILEDSARYGRIQTALKRLPEQLGEPGASARVAQNIVHMMETR